FYPARTQATALIRHSRQACNRGRRLSVCERSLGEPAVSMPVRIGAFHSSYFMALAVGNAWYAAQSGFCNGHNISRCVIDRLSAKVKAARAVPERSNGVD